jgi:diguanylate cyclase (GGDEF)-like protein
MTEPLSHRILIVDDDPQTADVIGNWFRGQPYEILAAADGETGLRRATEAVPDVILLDVRMPGIDGITVAGRLKTGAVTRGIPVVLLTACRDTETKIEAFRIGADDYVTKPFDMAEVDARIGVMLKRRAQFVALESENRDLYSKNEQLEQLLIIDEKTGLYNFRAFQRRLVEEWQRADRYSVPLSLVFLDLDNFKQVNDTLGHQAGDRVLEQFATLVAGGARANDVAARYGGEEFAVILPHTDGAMALRVAERIRRAVADFVFLEDEHSTRVTVSAGVATLPPSTRLDSVDELIRAADRALYAAKDLGRNRVVQAGEVSPDSTAAPEHDAQRRRATGESANSPSR